MADQHAGPLARLAVVDDILADQARAIGMVLDVFGMHSLIYSIPAQTLAEPA